MKNIGSERVSIPGAEIENDIFSTNNKQNYFQKIESRGTINNNFLDNIKLINQARLISIQDTENSEISKSLLKLNNPKNKRNSVFAPKTETIPSQDRASGLRLGNASSLITYRN